MLDLDWRTLCRVIAARPLGGHEPPHVSGVSTDTRALRPGDVFVALRGRQRDGHCYLEEAVERGAAGLIVSEACSVPPALLASPNLGVAQVPDTTAALGDLAAHVLQTSSAEVIAVTGSIGKSLVKAMIAHILSQQALVSWTERNYSNLVGLPLAALALRPDDRFAVLELAGATPAEIARLTAISRPAVGVLTAVGAGSLDRWGAFGPIARAKLAFLGALPLSAVAVVNGDESRLRLAARSHPGDVRWFGQRPGDDVRIAEVALDDAARPSARLLVRGRPVRLRLNVVGRHAVWNAAAALAATLDHVAEPEQAAAALESFPTLKGRLDLVQARGIRYVVDLTESHPLSTRAALETVAAVGEVRRRVAVLADMAGAGRGRPAADQDVGALVARLGYHALYAVGRHPEDLARAAQAGGIPAASVVCARHALELVDTLQAELREGDCVLLKGGDELHFGRLLELLSLR